MPDPPPEHPHLRLPKGNSGKRPARSRPPACTQRRTSSAARSSERYLGIIMDNADVIGAALRPRPPPPFTPLSTRRLTMPVLLIERTNTKPIFRITCEKLAGCLPDVQRAILPGTSHALCLEQPDSSNEAMLQFLNRH